MGSERIRLELVKALIASGELKEVETHTSYEAAQSRGASDRMERVRQKVDALEDIVYKSVTLRLDRQSAPVPPRETAQSGNGGQG